MDFVTVTQGEDYSVSGVALLIKKKISKLRDIWVKGEVGNSTRSAAGHSYFNLLDEGAALRCVMFHGGIGEREIETGAAVRAHGYVSLYQARGDIQLIADTIEPVGEGELQRKRDEIEKRLRAEGLFEESRKRPIPQFPRRVGVVTSPTGSVWHDIQNVTRRRYPLVELVLAETIVQGKEAAPHIVKALGALNEDSSIDVIIVARGGGSLEDLWAFNEEDVARAIFRGNAPVVSGVGHETDWTIADLVADVRAPTPSAAAEIVLPDQVDLKAKIGAHRRYLNASMGGRIAASSREIDTLRSRLHRGLPDFDTMRLRIDDLMRTTSAHARVAVQVAGERLNGMSARLASMNPKHTLGRGYAIVQRGNLIVTDPSQVNQGDPVEVTVARGRFRAIVANGTGPAATRTRQQSRKTPPTGQASMDLSER